MTENLRMVTLHTGERLVGVVRQECQGRVGSVRLPDESVVRAPTTRTATNLPAGYA